MPLPPDLSTTGPIGTWMWCLSGSAGSMKDPVGSIGRVVSHHKKGFGPDVVLTTFFVQHHIFRGLCTSHLVEPHFLSHRDHTIPGFGPIYTRELPPMHKTNFTTLNISAISRFTPENPPHSYSVLFHL